MATMSEEPRPDDTPQSTAPAKDGLAEQAGQSKRRFLIKALQVGSAVPVVMTISRPAFAQTTASHGHS
jgi:hypothetical protein